MTDIQLDDIPVCIFECDFCGQTPVKERFPWLAMFLVAIICTIIGIGAGWSGGWSGGYVMGVRDSINIMGKVFEEAREEKIEGYMPW